MPLSDIIGTTLSAALVLAMFTYLYFNDNGDGGLQ